eukprot:739514-Lingulodinium_polyedra.AAC.1
MPGTRRARHSCTCWQACSASARPMGSTASTGATRDCGGTGTPWSSETPASQARRAGRPNARRSSSGICNA